MKVAAFLPAKGTSSRITSKNLRLMDGKPLFRHTLEKLAACPFLDEVWLDTESDEVVGLAEGVPCRVLRRDPALATNATDGNAMFLNQVRHTDADIVVQVLGTAPFIKPETIRRAVDVLKEDPSHDSVVLVQGAKLYTWDAATGRTSYDISRIPNSVDLPETIIETMGLYAVRREAALATGRRVGERPYMLRCDPIEAVDVNWPEDFELADLIAAGQRERERRLLNNIKGLVSSPLMSDLMDDLGIDGVVTGLALNIRGAKVLGRANTLKLRAMREGEDFRRIYDALGQYRTVIPGDVIVVQNDEVGDYAYFGDLNANLSIRCGAAGTIVGGATRDDEAVSALGFPVWATRRVCTDVRKRAVVDTMGKPISLFGVPVNPGDLVFGDAEGIAVIPRRREREVLEAVFDRLRTEKNILVDIACGANVGELVDRHGAF